MTGAEWAAIAVAGGCAALSTGSALSAVYSLRAVRRWRERALMAEHTLERVLGRNRG